MSDKQVKLILKILSRQKFADWYDDDGEFGKFIMGDKDAKSENEILADIKMMFGE